MTMLIPQLSDMFSGESTSTKELDKLIEFMPCAVWCKDRNGIYRAANQLLLYTTGAVVENDLAGQNDAQLIQSEFSLPIISNELCVLKSGRPNNYVEYANASFGNIKTLCYKRLLTNTHGKIIGTMGVGFLLDEPNRVIDWLKHAGQTIKSDPMEYHFTNADDGLTKRQSDCLFYYVNGMPTKQIGKQLDISPKTVENHLEVVKVKLCCRGCHELISKALQLPSIKSRLYVS